MTNPDPKPLLTTLPGDIPGLLRNGSILRHNGKRAVALQVIEGFVLVAHHASGTDEETEVEGGTVPWDLVALDLTDPTARAHAAAWVLRHPVGLREVRFNERIYSIVRACQDFGEVSEPAIDALARLVLRLAGRTP